MKQTIKVIGLLLISTLLMYAQTPQAFKYQAVLRDNSGNPLANTSVTIELDVRQNNTSQYTETHSVTTNEYGQVDLEVGEGTTTGNFSGIDWGTGSYTMQVSVDNTPMGQPVKLLSVPYALYAENVESIENNAIRSNHIQDGTIQSDDIADGVLPHTSDENTFLGLNAGNHAGSRNTSIGYNAGTNGGGKLNVFVGSHAGHENHSGTANVFVGNDAGRIHNTGYENVFLGYEAGAATNSGNYNVFVGSNAGIDHETGNNNIFIGADAGGNNIGGENNTFLGFRAGVNNTGTGNVFIGYKAGLTAVGSNQLIIENDVVDLPLVYGEFDSQNLKINGNLTITGSCSGCSSDKRLKKNIKPLNHALTSIKTLSGVFYDWKKNTRQSETEKGKQIGVIAQEVELVFPELVGLDAQGYKFVHYQKLVVPLIEAVKELADEKDKEIASLQSEVAKLQKQLNTLQASVHQLTSQSPTKLTSNQE